ncbi:MAG: hypothetical protein KGL39_38165 [Patescibacteria group bacterium]|nr:hypothetical protein [Patescibacteria group bacterium]
MKRRVILVSVALLLAGCGVPNGPTPKSTPKAALAAPEPTGCMGACLPVLRPGLPPVASASRVPDVSEWQPCVDRPVPTVFRLAYGTRQDAKAACNGARLKAWHQWRAGYVYLLPGNCTAQGTNAARIAQRVGGVDLIVADGEEPLGPRCLHQFRAAAHASAHVPTATYTGCYSGLPREWPLWIPSYGSRPSCSPWVAWQYIDGTYCGQSFVTDCSIDAGLTSLRPTTEAERLLRADIAGREARRASSLTAEHQDWLLARFWRSRRPQTTALRRDWERREADRRKRLAEIAVDNRLIALWKRHL